MTDRDADRALKWLKRQGLAKFDNYNGIRGWKLTHKGEA